MVESSSSWWLWFVVSASVPFWVEDGVGVTVIWGVEGEGEVPLFCGVGWVAWFAVVGDAVDGDEEAGGNVGVAPELGVGEACGVVVADPLTVIEGLGEKLSAKDTLP